MMSAYDLKHLRSTHSFPKDFTDGKVGHSIYFITIGDVADVIIGLIKGESMESVTTRRAPTSDGSAQSNCNQRLTGFLGAGNIEHITPNHLLVQFSKGIKLQLEAEYTLWDFVPDADSREVHGFNGERKTAYDAAEFATTGVPLIIASGATRVSFDESSTGYEYWEGISTLSKVFVKGILAPAMAAEAGLKLIAKNVHNDPHSGKVILPTAAAAGVASACGAVALVSGSGVSGLSAAGVTSGLAAIGPGGMLGGVATICTGVGFFALATTGVTYAIYKSHVQSGLRERENILRKAAKNAAIFKCTCDADM